ncbi:hypothetical protein HKCCE2091_11490 [Rhodobacterales bacterium HKCCE2091]|nr:hypothetical protein [Rhodobacterales bacterium HKCCE2091]
MPVLPILMSHEVISPRDPAELALDPVLITGTADGGVVFAPSRDIGGYANSGGDNGGWPGGTPDEGDTWGRGTDDYINHSRETVDETIYTFAGNDTVFAGSGDTIVFAGVGDDEVYGGNGADTILGQDGDDILFGGLNHDEIHAGDGEDIVNGGQGNDKIFLTDDDQTDRILFALGDDSDIIDGFETGVDVVEIAGTSLDFDDLVIHYNGDGSQAVIEIAPGDWLTFTGLDGALSASDFDFL